ncbi:MAG TPA: hypothetical protein VG826_25095 [Pirellulales bacterium]|nr:hypothetical protein [Pirellulales bacterium]
MRPIGGFLELETGTFRGELHAGAVALTSGRACLAWILSVVRPTRVLAPYYCCDAVWNTLAESQVECRPYALDAQLRPIVDRSPTADEWLLYVNYFGLKSGIVRDLETQWQGRLIVDNTQSFYSTPTPNTWAFNSARKFFGVPDGGYLFGAELPRDLPANTEICWDHLIKRHLGRNSEAYSDFLGSEAKVRANAVGISDFSRRLLGAIDYDSVARRRRDNFQLYHQELGRSNTFEFSEHSDSVPLCYPFLPSRELPRESLAVQSIYIPTFWPELNTRPDNGRFSFERVLSQRLLPLPVDHRYSADDCLVVCRAIRGLLL